MAETLETGELQNYVFEQLQPNFATRYHKMVEAINKDLVPLGVRLPQTDREIVGGYFIWLTLPHSLKSVDLAKRAKDEENIIVSQVSTDRMFNPSPGHGCQLTAICTQGDIFEVSSIARDVDT